MKITLLLSLFPFFAFSQTNFVGTVSAEGSNEKIPYASIGLVKENTGINADADGKFILYSRSLKSGDSLLISAVGYRSKKIAVEQLASNTFEIKLSRQVPLMKPLLIYSTHNWQTAELNKFSGCSNTFFGSMGHLQQLARHFVMPRPNGKLTGVKICVGFLNRRSLFRVRVYDRDTLTGGPGNDLADTVIEVRTKKSIAKLNLGKYDIQIPAKDFFVAVEWLKVAENVDSLRQPVDGNYVTYRPSLGMINSANDSRENWILDYNSRWKQFSNSRPFDKDLLISVTVKH